MKALLFCEAKMLAHLLCGRTSPLRFLVNLSVFAFLADCIIRSYENLNYFKDQTARHSVFLSFLASFVILFGLFLFTGFNGPPPDFRDQLGFGFNYIINYVGYLHDGNYYPSEDWGNNKIVSVTIASTDSGDGVCSNNNTNDYIDTTTIENFSASAPSIDHLDQIDGAGANQLQTNDQLQLVPVQGHGMKGTNAECAIGPTTRRIISRGTTETRSYHYCNHINDRHNYYCARRYNRLARGYGGDGMSRLPCGCLSDEEFTDFITKTFAKMKGETILHNQESQESGTIDGIPLLTL